MLKRRRAYTPSLRSFLKDYMPFLDNFHKEIIYLDAASGILPRITNEEVVSFFGTFTGANPQSKHSLGEKTKEVLRTSQEIIAQHFEVSPDEIIFTSGATESNSLALIGSARAHSIKNKAHHQNNNKIPPKNSIVISNLEHASIRGIKEWAAELNIEVRIAQSNSKGIITPEEVSERMDSSTILVSITGANGEIGTIQPIRQIVRSVKKISPQCIFHSDMTQCPLWMNIYPRRFGIDLMTCDSSKFGGQRGVGLLYVKRGITLSPLFLTADQLVTRPGTPAVELIAQMALVLTECPADYRKVEKVRNTVEEWLSSYPNITLNAQYSERLPSITSFSMKGVHHEFLRVLFDQEGLIVSTGSACSSGDEEVASVAALKDESSSAIRLSYSPFILYDSDAIIYKLKKVIESGLL